MRHSRIFRAWGQILLGRRPALALEVTNKCPLSCPGCYAYHPHHVSGTSLELIRDYRGDELVERVLGLVNAKRPQGLFLVGGEPLLRIKELRKILPEMSKRGIEVEVVTSGVVSIPPEWMQLRGLCVVISIDGLQPEHDRRRSPATYERILRNIEGLKVHIHCTVTSQMARVPDSLNQFLSFWSAREEIRGIRVSLYTPQVGESSGEILSWEERAFVISELDRLGRVYKKLRLSADMVRAYRNPPETPSDCIFAQVTECISADLKTAVLPCQLGGEPDCNQCGCVAAVGMEAVGLYRLPGGLSVGTVFQVSHRIGAFVEWIRRRILKPADHRGEHAPELTSINGRILTDSGRRSLPPIPINRSMPPTPAGD